MALPPHPPTFINPWWIKKAELGESSLDVVQKSYEGNIETTSSLTVWGKNRNLSWLTVHSISAHSESFYCIRNHSSHYDSTQNRGVLQTVISLF